MKITKFPQSCILIESKGIKILIDPGEVLFQERFFRIWKNVDAVFVSHKHRDHFSEDILNKLGKPVYTTHEVEKECKSLKVNVIKEKDVLVFGEIKINVVKAIHGYLPGENEVKENVGFIVDDGKTSVWYTSDTIRFKNKYKADLIIANITAYDVSMNLWGAVQNVQDAGAKLLIVAHQDKGRVLYKKQEIENYLKEQKVNYIIPETMRTLEIKIYHN